jgi:hypothetical protein
MSIETYLQSIVDLPRPARPDLRGIRIRDVILYEDGTSTGSELPSCDGTAIRRAHAGRGSYELLRELFPELGSDVPDRELAAEARKTVGFDAYVVRLDTI